MSDEGLWWEAALVRGDTMTAIRTMIHLLTSMPFFSAVEEQHDSALRSRPFGIGRQQHAKGVAIQLSNLIQYFTAMVLIAVLSR